MFEKFMDLIENGEKLSQLPGRCFLFWINKPQYVTDISAIGYRWDGYVYLLRKAQYDNKTDAYIHADYPRVGLLNQSWWCVRQPEDEDIREFVLSLFPGWVDKDLARRVLEINDYKNLSTIVPVEDGRYYDLQQRRMATNQRDMLWLMMLGGKFENTRFDPGVKLLYNNGENQFTGHPLQIWDDGLWSRGEFLDFGATKKTEILKEAGIIMKFIRKELAQEIGVEKILAMQWCDKTEIAWLEAEKGGCFAWYNEEYRAEKWVTDAGTFYVLFHDWGSFNGEGDAGSDGDVFLTLAELKAEFIHRADLQKKLPG
ncbi:MAG: hypothetical protein AB1453_12080 [Chloroflexota bacterium]